MERPSVRTGAPVGVATAGLTVTLPDDTFGLVQVELRAIASYTRRAIYWLLFARSGFVDSGELHLPAVVIWQAVAHVERLLRDQRIRLQGSDEAER